MSADRTGVSPPAGGAPALALRVRNVVRAYRTRSGTRVAVDGVSLDVRRGEWLALLGPNGSGKSTLMRVLATLETPDVAGARGAPEVDICGASVLGGSDRSAARARLGVVFQSTSLDRLLTVRENLMAQAVVMAVPRGARASRVEGAASACGVADRLDERVGRLSGGLARRADLARAFVGQPDLLLLDEPTSGMDLAAREGFFESIARLRGERGVAVVMSTHLMDEAERADTVAMMDAGRVVKHAAPSVLREEAGAVVIRARGSAGALERGWEWASGRGLDLSRGADGAMIVRGAGIESRVGEVCGGLVHAGCAVEAGPPTLGDAYLAATGRGLGSAQGDEA